MVKTFKDLLVWQKSHRLTMKIYLISKSFPIEEKFGLTSDIRRAARSVPTNLVEGYGRKGYKDALNFFNISEASLQEVKYHLILACDLKYICQKSYEEISSHADEVGRLLKGWIRSYKPKTQT